MHGIHFRNGVWDDQNGLLLEPSIGEALISEPLSLWLRPVAASELPGRAKMKAERLHWSEVPFFAVPPQSTDDQNLDDPICTVFVRTTYRNATVHEKGVCALLSDT